MKNLLYIAALGLTIIGCSKPTIEDEGFDTTPPITQLQPQTNTGSQTNTDPTSGTVSNTTTTGTPEESGQSDTDTVSGTRIDVPGGYVIRIDNVDPKGNVDYTWEIYPNENFKLVAYSSGDGYAYDEGNLQGEISEFIFEEITTFEYNGRTFEIESSLAQHIPHYKSQWDLAKADMTGTDGGDYDNRFVILQSRNYFFGALAADGYSIYRSSNFERGTILHEIGHVWSLRNGSPVNWDEFSVLMQNYHVSNYGATALTEYFAEAFSHHFLNKAGDPYHTLPQEVIDVLESYGL